MALNPQNIKENLDLIKPKAAEQEANPLVPLQWAFENQQISPAAQVSNEKLKAHDKKRLKSRNKNCMYS